MNLKLHEIWNADAVGSVSDAIGIISSYGVEPVIVTDPPFNIGYHYDNYNDRMPDHDYYKMLSDVVGDTPAVMVLYPEALHRFSMASGRIPDRVVSWIYPSNTKRQHRDIGFYGVVPDFDRVRHHIATRMTGVSVNS